MTDRFNALTIVLDRDIRSDDAQSVIDAIKMVRGVQSVTPNIADMTDHIAYVRARGEIAAKLFEVLRDKTP